MTRLKFPDGSCSAVFGKPRKHPRNVDMACYGVSTRMGLVGLKILSWLRRENHQRPMLKLVRSFVGIQHRLCQPGWAALFSASDYEFYVGFHGFHRQNLQNRA